MLTYEETEAARKRLQKFLNQSSCLWWKNKQWLSWWEKIFTMKWN